jgi:hypothetical protein
MLLDFAELPGSLVEERMDRLEADLESGRWESSHSLLQGAASYDGGLRLVVFDLSDASGAGTVPLNQKAKNT